MTRRMWSRVAQLLDWWIRPLASLSGVVVCRSEALDHELSAVAKLAARDASPNLHKQLEEILESVWREERMWRIEDRVEGSFYREMNMQPGEW